MTTRRLLVTLVAVALLLAALTSVAFAAPLGTPQTAPQAGYSCVAYYTVQAGDNLYRISLKYNVSMAALMAANGITNPNVVYAGQTLCIPGSAPVPPPPPPPPPPGITCLRLRPAAPTTRLELAIPSAALPRAIGRRCRRSCTPTTSPMPISSMPA